MSFEDVAKAWPCEWQMSSQTMDAIGLEQIKAIEKALLKLDCPDLCNEGMVILLELRDCGCWLLKFRCSGLIVNNCIMVSFVLADVSALISFQHAKKFLELSNTQDKKSTVEGLLKKDCLSIYGGNSPRILHSLFLQNPHQAVLMEKSNNYVCRDYLGDIVVPLKKGWLYKKSYVFAGWRPCFVVVYPTRIIYFVNDNDYFPRDVISLLGASILPPKKCTINGEVDHYSISIALHVDNFRSLRLATETLGIEAYTEAMLWTRAISAAAKCNEYVGSYSTLETHANTRGSDIERIPSIHSSGSKKLAEIITDTNLDINRSSEFMMQLVSVAASFLPLFFILEVVVAVIAWYIYGIHGLTVVLGIFGICAISFAYVVINHTSMQETLEKSPISGRNRLQRSSSFISITSTRSLGSGSSKLLDSLSPMNNHYDYADVSLPSTEKPSNESLDTPSFNASTVTPPNRLKTTIRHSLEPLRRLLKSKRVMEVDDNRTET